MIVLDASALLALLLDEPGAARVAAALPDAVVGAVNLSEVVAKLAERGVPGEAIAALLGGLDLDVRPFDAAQAYAAGELRRQTRGEGLSLGDRACLALAAQLGVPALTADRIWLSAGAGIAEIELIR